VFDTLRHFIYQLSERFHDWRLGVRTDAIIHLHEVGIQDPDCHCYAATNYRRFKQVLDRVTLTPGQDGFIDYGSGLGRVVLLAAGYPFKRVIGLEVAEELHKTAERNLAVARAKLKCRDVQLLNADARTYEIPADITVLYFWNPFSESILRSVCQQLARSLTAAPRTVTVCYASPYTPNCLENIIGEFPWLRARETLSLGAHMHVTVADNRT
jgi:SAM-dependent methyltransferase